MPTQKAKGKRVDQNFYYSRNPAIKDKYAAFGWDQNSMVGDPKFVDPESGDFRVEQGSPAFAVGFENFAMDQFGVQKPSLKAIASKPVLPTPDPERRVQSPYETKQPQTLEFAWLGANVDSLTGEEFSAFGVSRDSGGVKVSRVSAGSDAARLGLRSGDLVQKLNGQQVKTVTDLLRIYTRGGNLPLEATVIRNQEPLTLRSDELAYVTLETTDDPTEFVDHVLPSQRPTNIATKPPTKNEPVSILSDGQVGDGYGPIFSNGTPAGVYRVDLGRSKPVSIIASWSTDFSGRRGPQKLTLYASDSNQRSRLAWRQEIQTEAPHQHRHDIDAFQTLHRGRPSSTSRNVARDFPLDLLASQPDQQGWRTHGVSGTPCRINSDHELAWKFSHSHRDNHETTCHYHAHDRVFVRWINQVVHCPIPELHRLSGGRSRLG